MYQSLADGSSAAGVATTALRLQRAPALARRLFKLAGALLLLSLTLVGISLHAVAATSPLWPPLLRSIAAALLVCVAALHSAYFIARWRCRIVRANPWAWSVWLRQRLQWVGTEPPRWYLPWPRRAAAASVRWLRQLGHEFFQALWLTLVAGGALVLVLRDWNLAVDAQVAARTGFLCGGITLFAAFALLVLERWLANVDVSELPEGRQVAKITRVSIATLCVCSLALFLQADGSIEGATWPAKATVLAGLLPAIVAFEIVLRTSLSLFVRQDDAQEPDMAAHSIFASLFRWPPRPLATLEEELRVRFDIDLRQNWAFAYMRRTALPVLGVVVLLGWLVSGLREIPFDGRGIYERLGQPVRVLGPGLHVGLPWPFARIRSVENGVVHALATTLDDDAADTSTAEGPPPESANRLWDDAHVSENTQIIASASGERQNFQVVSMDVRFIYRIGLSDAQALAATYRSADIPTLIRSTAGRVLVRDFASRTLDGVLGEQRNVIAAQIGRAVQRDLDAVGSGVEILATLLEQIHPPAGAANAYHGVQAALIKSQATIARERGRASNASNEARLQASLATDKARAVAREARARAEVVKLEFAAERDAYDKAGKAFLLEQYLSRLSQGLAGRRALILDHRINGTLAPTIDLRTDRAAGGAPDPMP